MLSIIIVHYDTAEDLCDCLDSLQQIPPSVEVVVVDNHSPTNPERARRASRSSSTDVLGGHGG